jgi:hypothetical protein
MPTLISCPMCGLEGELPDDLVGGLIACPRCNGQFAPSAGVPSVTLSSGVGGGASPDATVSSGRPTTPAELDGMSVYVGSQRVPVDVNTPPPARSLSPDLGPYAVRQPEGWDDPGVEVTEETAAAHLGWLRQEVARFNRFVAQQLDLIRRSREEMARTDAQVTAAFVTREQEMGREKATRAARAAALEKRAADREAELDARAAALEKRLAEVERMEASVQRKLQEAEEIEETLRTELEDREREVEQQRLAVEEAARELRCRPLAPPADLSAAGDEFAFPCG